MKTKRSRKTRAKPHPDWVKVARSMMRRNAHGPLDAAATAYGRVIDMGSPAEHALERLAWAAYKFYKANRLGNC